MIDDSTYSEYHGTVHDTTDWWKIFHLFLDKILDRLFAAHIAWLDGNVRAIDSEIINQGLHLIVD